MMLDIEASSNHSSYHPVDQLPPDQIMKDDMPSYEPPTFLRSGVKNPRRRRRRILMAAVAFAVVAVIAIVLGVTLGGGSDTNNSSNSSRSSGASDGTSDRTAVPTVAPSASIVGTTAAPTTAPIAAPTTMPTAGPTGGPTGGPTLIPTSVPTMVNTTAPTTAPTPLPERFLDVVEFLADQGISSLENLTADGSPQNLAALWIADQDALRLPFGNDDYQVGVVNEAYDFVVRYVLAVFFLSTEGPTGWWNSVPWWSTSLRFMSDDPVCQWRGPNLLRRTAGVFCNEENQVFRLRLDFVGLEGRLPQELGKIWTLSSIDLNWNFLTGPLPEALTELPLRFLVAMRNNLQGPLPANLGQNGELRVLDLSNNDLTGTVPSSLTACTELIYFVIDNNRLEGDVTEMVTNDMQQLTHVILEGNLLTGTLGDEGFLSNHTNLIYLDMSDNMLDGKLPEHFFDMESLRVLDLHGNMLTGNLPELPVNNVLDYVSVHQNQISGPIPDSIVNLGALGHLDLSSNLLDGPMPPLFNNMTFLTYLFLAENNFAPGNIPDYGDMIYLRELSLKSTGRTGSIPDFLAGMEELVLLDLDDNQLTGPFPDFFVNMTSLYGLLLNRNLLTGPIPSGLDNLQNLRLLYLDRNSLTGTLEDVCSLNGWANPDPEAMNYLAADCGLVGASTFEVNCTCCTHCCTDGTDEGCHENFVIPSANPVWETSYDRPGFTFGNETYFESP